MGNPYRGPDPRLADDDGAPDFGNRPPVARDAVVTTAFYLSPVAVAYVCGGVDQALRALVCFGPCILLSVLIMLLERPVRAFLAERHARIVVRGVAELEAKASLVDSRK